MEIIKMFSSYDGENLYTVCFSEEEMKLYKQFSSKTLAGIKGGLKGAGYGAFFGAVPGMAVGETFRMKPKNKLISAGLTSAAGAMIGARAGYNKAIDSWKYENDPEYKKKIDEGEHEFWIKEIEKYRKESKFLLNDYNLQDWIKFSSKYNLPSEVLKYVRFYTSWSKKNIDKWYDNLVDPGANYLIPAFHDFFLAPMNTEMSDDWYEYDDWSELAILTNNDPDDGVYYNTKTKNFGWISSTTNKSIKDFFTKHLKNNMEYYKDSLSQENLKIINDFKSHL